MKTIYLFVLLLMLSIFAISCSFAKQDFYEIVEEMPRFPGCDNVEGNDKAKQECSLTKMYEFLYSKAKYTPEELGQNPDNNIFYTFIVDTLGNITEPKMLIENNTIYALEGLRVLQEMANLPTKWTPAKRKGKLVKVRMHIYLNFKAQS